LSRTNRMACSIEERPQKINNRFKYGHWEGDCVKGPLGCATSLFTLTKRKTLEEIIIKIDRTTQEEIKRALDELEEKYGDSFKLKFKSITFYNGVECLNWRSLELFIFTENQKRTIT
jgi:IS30 family transposase